MDDAIGSFDTDLTDDEEILLHGQCHLFAIALHRLTGLPLAAYLDTDDKIDGVVLCHAFVVDGDYAIDVRGRMALDDVLAEFDTNEPWFEDITEQDLLRLATGNDEVQDDDSYYAVAIECAQAVAHGLAFTVSPC